MSAITEDSQTPKVNCKHVVEPTDVKLGQDLEAVCLLLLFSLAESWCPGLSACFQSYIEYCEVNDNIK